MKLPFWCLVTLTFLTANTFAQVNKKPVTKTPPPMPGLTAQLASGKKVFTLNCLPCHQADGLGLPNMYPPLSKTTYVLGDKVQLIRIALGGFNDAITINGETYTDVMPSFGILKDKEVADLLTYVRNSFGNKADAVTAAEVKKVRAMMKR